MDPRVIYRESYSPGWSRVDMLLALFDGAIIRLEMAAGALGRGERETAVRLLTRAGLIVCELAAGVDTDYAHAAEFLRLYAVASRAIGAATVEQTGAALAVLRAMREGLAGLREEAARLEREGVLPPPADGRMVPTRA
jgi:flagellin-specific chaperone FliS